MRNNIIKSNVPKKIAIIGNPGSGKSTFAYNLGKLLNIPVHHLDTYAFVNDIRTKRDDLIEIQKELVSHDSWIIEGCSISTLSVRFEKADIVIYLDMPRLQCLWRTLKRSFVFNKISSNSGCIRLVNWALLKYICRFEKDKKPQIYKAKDKFPRLNFKTLTSTKQVQAFLEKYKK